MYSGIGFVPDTITLACPADRFQTSTAGR